MIKKNLASTTFLMMLIQNLKVRTVLKQLRKVFQVKNFSTSFRKAKGLFIKVTSDIILENLLRGRNISKIMLQNRALYLSAFFVLVKHKRKLVKSIL